MALKLYMDHHVHGYVTAYLRSQGIDVLTAREDAHHDVLNEQLLERAQELGRVVVTYDHDFFVIHAAWMKRGRRHLGILHINTDNATPAEVLEDLLLAAITSQSSHIENQIERLPV